MEAAVCGTPPVDPGVCDTDTARLDTSMYQDSTVDATVTKNVTVDAAAVCEVPQVDAVVCEDPHVDEVVCEDPRMHAVCEGILQPSLPQGYRGILPPLLPPASVDLYTNTKVPIILPSASSHPYTPYITWVPGGR